ncbi:MAG TPA: hypothetical protein VF626_00550 [Chthoniobacterales bacterium]
MKKRLRGVVALMVIGLALQSAAAGERVVSKYTSTARAKSISFREDKGEGPGGSRGLFPGLGGYQLEHLSGDERSWINIRYGKKTVDLYEATMKEGPGAFPHKENDVVEWRGVEKDGRFIPYAIIYRLAGYDEERNLHKTRLIVIQLDKERSAVIGHAEGAKEDVEAKQIADRARPR